MDVVLPVLPPPLKSIRDDWVCIHRVGSNIGKRQGQFRASRFLTSSMEPGALQDPLFEARLASQLKHALRQHSWERCLSSLFSPFNLVII